MTPLRIRSRLYEFIRYGYRELLQTTMRARSAWQQVLANVSLKLAQYQARVRMPTPC